MLGVRVGLGLGGISAEQPISIRSVRSKFYGRDKKISAHAGNDVRGDLQLMYVDKFKLKNGLDGVSFQN